MRDLRCALRLACLALPWFFASVEALAQAAADPPRRPRIGLVLSGGGALGIAHVGVLKVLEENRIPVDYVTGTSMGSIVGASYASGMSPQEMERKVKETDWAKVFADAPPRQDRTTRRKALDLVGLWGLEIGFSKGKLFLPKGAIEGQTLKGVLRTFVIEAPGKDFSKLPIPFRCVATDLVTGQPVVLASGDLDAAIRASMSVPGVISPQQIGDHLLLDGGLVRNLPVDVARDMGAEIIIAVNLGTPLLKKEDLGDVLGVSMQMINILTQQNVDRSLAELKPDDILITPDLKGFTASSFERGADIIPKGEAAARQVLERLKRYSLTPEQYEAHRLAQTGRLQRARPADDIVVRTEGLKFVNPATVEAALMDRGVKLHLPGDEGRFRLLERREGIPDEVDVERKVARLYGSGDFDNIAYRYVDVDGKRLLEVEPTERARGPDYFRFGLKLQSDFKGEGSFNLLAFYNKTWINRLGAEWRTLGQVGRDPGIMTEFYQPLDLAGRFFVAPNAFANERLLDVFLDGSRIAQYQLRQAGVGLDVGTVLDKWGELRFGYVRGSGSGQPSIGLPGFPTFDYDIGALRTRLIYDQLDSVNFPTAGSLITGDWWISRRSLGSSDDYARVGLSATKVLSHKAHTLSLGARGATTYQGSSPVNDSLSLGGFLNLSGYRTGQFLGEDIALLRAVYYYRLYRVPPVADGIFIGGSLEAGNAYKRFDRTDGRGFLYSASVFLGADTFIGPLYLAYGQAFSGDNAFYLFMGRP